MVLCSSIHSIAAHKEKYSNLRRFALWQLPNKRSRTVEKYQQEIMKRRLHSAGVLSTYEKAGIEVTCCVGTWPPLLSHVEAISVRKAPMM